VLEFELNRTALHIQTTQLTTFTHNCDFEPGLPERDICVSRGAPVLQQNALYLPRAHKHKHRTSCIARCPVCTYKICTTTTPNPMLRLKKNTAMFKIFIILFFLQHGVKTNPPPPPPRQFFLPKMLPDLLSGIQIHYTAFCGKNGIQSDANHNTF
jgi:hypothetical protein